MIPDLWHAALRHLLAPLRVALRRNWFYRRLLKGRMPDRIRHHPFDALPRRLEDADMLLKGRFRFAGELVETKGGPVFDLPAPSAQWAAALHGFDWLAALSAAGGEAARHLATELSAAWMERNARYAEPAWLPEITARRLVHIFAHGRFMLANSDVLWRSRLFVSLREQTAQLGRIADEAPPGLPRLETAAAYVLACACLDANPRRLEAGLLRLQQEIAAQILPDGGHISRSPEALLMAYRQIVMVVDALAAVGAAVPSDLRSAHDRLAPMLRFFRHGDGALALFNGGGESDARMISSLLARDEVGGQPFLHAPHSGYQRLAATKSIAIVDCGGLPPGPYAQTAHAGCLAFEFAASGQRLVVNCGAEREGASRWDGALRATAAHSTVTLADTSMASLLAPGLVRDLLGPRLLGGPAHVKTERHETPHGRRVDASHDFYLQEFGIRHQRELMLSRQGTKLTGCDRLLPDPARRRSATSFAVRFHIHPDVRVSLSHRGDILLKLPSGEGWRFRHGGTISVEESIYAGQGSVRRTEQLVLSGFVKNEPVETAWMFEQIGADASTDLV
ncbi:MAG TPA: heparinase II/III family protein [Rhizomicrobium sp.]|jgi:uncharacterized heparinase superfamily protein